MELAQARTGTQLIQGQGILEVLFDKIEHALQTTPTQGARLHTRTIRDCNVQFTRPLAVINAHYFPCSRMLRQRSNLLSIVCR
jgi:hypothetical protein